MKKKSVSKDPNDPDLALNDLRTEIMDRYDHAKKSVHDWNEVAKEDMNFALGQQWTEEELTELKKAARPALTFNRIRPVIKVVSGYQRENSARIKVNPEGGEDRVFSEVQDRIIKHIDKGAHLSQKMAYWFDDGLYTGKGWLEAVITYESDPIRGELRFLQRSPYQIIADPDFNEYDLNEWPRAQYVFKVVRLTKDALKALFPKKKALIDGFVADTDDQVENGSGLLSEGADDDYGNQPNKTTPKSSKRKASSEEPEKDTKFTVKEYWRPKMVEKYFVIDKESGEPKKFDTNEEATAFAATQGEGIKVIPRKVPQMWVAVMVGGFVLQDEKSPFEPYYSGFPFFRFLADWAPSAETEELKVQGIVRCVKDPQREKNKSKSQNLHILNTQANSGWIGDDEALTPQGWKDLELMGSKPGITIKKKKGFELREILPKGPNMGHLQRENQADEEFKQISAVNPDLMGMQEGTASGRAISMRIKQAVMSLVHIFHNFRYSKEIIGNFILQMIPMLFDEKKVKKILGPQYMAKAVDPERYPKGLQDGHIAAFLKMIEDNKYDVFVSEADQNKTIRYETFQDLVELRKAGGMIPDELIVDYMDLPNSEEVKQEIKKFQMQQMAMAQAGQKRA